MQLKLKVEIYLHSNYANGANFFLQLLKIVFSHTTSPYYAEELANGT